MRAPPNCLGLVLRLRDAGTAWVLELFAGWGVAGSWGLVAVGMVQPAESTCHVHAHACHQALAQP